MNTAEDSAARIVREATVEAAPGVARVLAQAFANCEPGGSASKTRF
jgi:hypothetical protein